MRMRSVLLLLVLAPSFASAEPWLVGGMTEAGPHPRTILLEEELEVVQGRLDREPYLTQLERLVGWASHEGDPDDHEPHAELNKANAARAAAWLFYVDRTIDEDGNAVPFADEAARLEVGQIAATYLLAMYTESRAKGWIDFVEDIFTAQELHLWAEALDLLLGADLDVLGDDRAAAIQGVADLAADFYADHTIENWIACRALVNNHRTKSAAALGIVAIVLNGEDFVAHTDDGRYDPALWVDFGLRNVDFVLRDILTDIDGGIMEGGSYLGYSAIDHAPFLWAWHRYTGGASHEMTWDEPVPPYYVLGAAEPYVVPDMWNDPVIEAQLLWSVRTMLPDGTFPPFDDSSPGGKLFFGAFVNESFEHAGLYRWAWERNGQAAGGSVDTAPLIIAAYDDSVAAVTPEEAGLETHQVLPHAGQVVFRSGWSEDAVVAVMMCEHGNAAARSQTRWGQRIDGAGGHEHPDPLSLMLYAGSEPLIIDSGYLGWEDHDKVWDPTHHNLMLVDGEGPAMPYLEIPLFDMSPDGEVVLLDYTAEGGWTAPDDGQAYVLFSDVASDGIALVEAFTSYRIVAPPTDLWRRMALLADRFVVLYDRVEVADGEPHTLTHTLHTNCGGDSGGEYAGTEHGATCLREAAAVQIVVLTPSTNEQTTREDVHDAGYWAERTHTVLETDVLAPGGEPVEFLSLLLPDVDGEIVDVDVVECDGACASWTWEDGTCTAWLGEQREVLTPDGAPVLEADGGAYCVDDEALVGWFAGLPAEPGMVLSLRIELDGGSGPSGWRAAVHAVDEGAVGVSLTLPAIEGSEPDGACDWQEDGQGGWRIEVTAPSVIQTAAATRGVVAVARMDGLSFDEPRVVDLGDEVLLDASASCGDDPATYSWTLEQRPEMSTVHVSGADQPTLALEPDLPGPYRLSVTVTAGEEADHATVEFDVVGETSLADPGDDDDSSGPDPADDGDDDDVVNTNPGGCGCRAGSPAHGGAGWLIALATALAWKRRRGPGGLVGDRADGRSWGNEHGTAIRDECPGCGRAAVRLPGRR